MFLFFFPTGVKKICIALNLHGMVSVSIHSAGFVVFTLTKTQRGTGSAVTLFCVGAFGIVPDDILLRAHTLSDLTKNKK